MNVRSLGYRTDLIFPSFEGEISTAATIWSCEPR